MVRVAAWSAVFCTHKEKLIKDTAPELNYLDSRARAIFLTLVGPCFVVSNHSKTKS